MQLAYSVAVLRGLATILGLAACSAPAPTPPAIKQVGGSEAPPARVVRMERTECMSGCPTYAVELWSDGRVVWDGLGSVARLGRAEGVIAPRDIAKIVSAFDAAGFFTLERQPKFFESCPPNGGRCITILCAATDQTTTIVAITRGTATHELELVPCGEPDRLDDAIQLVDQLAHTRTWVGH